MFFPCPENHIARDGTEELIRMARVRLAYGMDDADVHAELTYKGFDAGSAHLAIIAAKILMKDG